MNALLTIQQAADYLSLKTPEAAEKALRRLGVPKYDLSIVGSKGIRYRRADIEDALSKIEVKPKGAKPRKPKRPPTDIFDLPVNEAAAILTHGHP